MIVCEFVRSRGWSSNFREGSGIGDGMIAEGNSGWLFSGGGVGGIGCRPWAHVETEGSVW
jgi:hypothetical protein